jgi:hypothetical protein
MNFTVETEFADTVLKSLIWRAVSICFGGSASADITVTGTTGCDQATAQVIVPIKTGRRVTVPLSNEFLVLAVAAGSAEDGNPIKRDSVRFVYRPHNGYGNTSWVYATATADLGATTDAASYQKEIKKFKLPLQVKFDKAELMAMVKRNVEGATGKVVDDIILRKMDAGVSASVSLKMPGKNSISLDTAQMQTLVTEELTSQGYDVEAGGVAFTYQASTGYGSTSSIGAEVKLNSLPV